MSFTEGKFLLFLVCALLVYFLTPKKLRWRVLLLVSYVFYWLVGGFFALGVLSLTTVSVYIAARILFALRAKNARKSLRRIPLIVCLCLNFGLLFVFRYSGSFVPAMGTLLIPGISFYTFQATGYLIDVYKGKVNPDKDPFRLALFVSFFPQLAQGPISRHSDIAKDLFAGHAWNWDNARTGVQRIILGYFMQVVIADLAAVPVNTVFSDHHSFGGIVIIIALIAYSVQIYASFAGGINIAIGIGNILGIHMPENFAQPFFARTLTDFWRRWHITLNTWLKDYLFYPLALSKPFGKLGKLTRRVFGTDKGKMVPTSIATFIIYFVICIWHGISDTTLVFGLLNASLITISLYTQTQFEALGRKLNPSGSRWGKVFATCRTFCIILFLRYFSRASSLDQALSMLKRTILHVQIRSLWNGSLLQLGLGISEWAILIFAVAILLLRDAVAYRHGTAAPEEKLNKANPMIQFAVLLIFLALITYCGIFREGYTASDLIYAQY